jgi:putative flippase GtrA
MRKLLLQFTRFGLVGGVGFLVNLAIFNLLIFTVFEQSRVHEGPLFANIIATSVAILVNWIGNRFWTFREHRGRQLAREGIEFALVSLGGLLIGLACLWVSHYLLGFDSKLADNISSNGIGLALGTAFRFALYRLWVFSPRRGEPEPALFRDADDLEPAEPAAPTISRSPARLSRPGAATGPVAVVPQSD